MTKNEALTDELKKAEVERQTRRRGAARLNKAMRKVLAGMTPPDDLTVSQWAESKRRLSAENVHPLAKPAIQNGIATDEKSEIDGNFFTAQDENTIWTMLPKVIEALK